MIWLLCRLISRVGPCGHAASLCSQLGERATAPIRIWWCAEEQSEPHKHPLMVRPSDLLGVGLLLWSRSSGSVVILIQLCRRWLLPSSAHSWPKVSSNKISARQRLWVLPPEFVRCRTSAPICKGMDSGFMAPRVAQKQIVLVYHPSKLSVIFYINLFRVVSLCSAL